MPMSVCERMCLTCVKGHPLTGRAGAGAPFSPYAEAVPVATLEVPDCAGGVWCGAAHMVVYVEALGRGVIQQVAVPSCPGDISRVVAAVQHRQ